MDSRKQTDLLSDAASVFNINASVTVTDASQVEMEKLLKGGGLVVLVLAVLGWMQSEVVVS